MTDIVERLEEGKRDLLNAGFTRDGFLCYTIDRAISELQRPRLPVGYRVFEQSGAYYLLHNDERLIASRELEICAFLSAFLDTPAVEPAPIETDIAELVEWLKEVSKNGPTPKLREAYEFYQKHYVDSSAPIEPVKVAGDTAGVQPRIHILKTHGNVWDKVESGEKRFEVRKDDRQFVTGDVVVLRRTNPINGEYSLEDGKPRDLAFKVGFILFGGQYGIARDHCVFQLEGIAPATPPDHLDVQKVADESKAPITLTDWFAQWSEGKPYSWTYQSDGDNDLRMIVGELCKELDRRLDQGRE